MGCDRKELPLHIACLKQSLDMVKLVSDCDPNSRKSGKLGDTPLHMAFRLRSIDIATYLIESGKCDLSIENNEGELPIHCACKLSLELVKLTTDFCWQNLVNIATSRGETPLHFACLHRKIETVKFLVEEKKADLTTCDKNGLKPLHYAMPCGFLYYLCNEPSDNDSTVAVLKYLVTECGCNPLEESDSNHIISPLEKSILAGNLKLVKALMSANLINVNHLNSRGDSMLHVACRHEQVDIVKFLVEDQYCSQMIQNHAGKLPIHIACESNSLDIVKLVSSNCKINTKTAAGETPLHIACRHNHIVAIEHLMTGIQNTADPTIADDDGNLPLHIACEGNSLALVKLVSNCDVNARTRDGNTPLHVVLKQCSKRYTWKRKKKAEIIEYLVNEKHSNLKLSDNYRQLPLHIACEYWSLAVVKLVSNCDINARTKYGIAPIDIALNSRNRDKFKIMKYLLSDLKCDSNNSILIHKMCRQGQLEIVKLLTNTESVHCKDEGGNTPLHVACYHQKLNVIKFLVGLDESGVTLQKVNKDGDTPLHLACKGGFNSQVIQFLVESNTVWYLNIE